MTDRNNTAPARNENRGATLDPVRMLHYLSAAVQGFQFEDTRAGRQKRSERLWAEIETCLKIHDPNYKPGATTEMLLRQVASQQGWDL